jgi:chemotaxis protein methyltransferase CheR
MGIGQRAAVDSLKTICRFRKANLLSREEMSTLGQVDVIFCRNVLIHMHDYAREQIVDQFYDRLAPGGFLFLGHSESLLNASTRFQVRELPEDICYRKPSLSESTPPLNIRDSRP